MKKSRKKYLLSDGDTNKNNSNKRETTLIVTLIVNSGKCFYELSFSLSYQD
jgi:hypothetical protein